MKETVKKSSIKQQLNKSVEYKPKSILLYIIVNETNKDIKFDSKLDEIKA